MQEERTEKATPKRRADARKKGQVAKSREIGSVLVLLAGASILFLLSSNSFRQLSGLMSRYLGEMTRIPLTLGTLYEIEGEVLRFLMEFLAPLLLALLAISLLSQYLQVGFLFSTDLLVPKASRLLNFRRLFSGQAAMELLKALAKVAIVGYVAYTTIQAEVPRILSLSGQAVGEIFRSIGTIGFFLAMKIILVMVLLAGLDYLYQRWAYERNLRMSREDLREEEKQTEGDPLVRARMRSIQRQMARKRMMAEVPKADVVITNPTHLAVALYYNRETLMAPKVVAKGAGFVAERIKEIAQANRVPIVENRPLAQVLFKTVEVGQLIPERFYQVVADVLAFVYRLKNRTR
jgi:flagellar biosynthetic protein FlhB